MSNFEKFPKLPRCAGGCHNTEKFIAKLTQKEYTKCNDCKNLVFDDSTPRSTSTGRESVNSPSAPRSAPYSDAATLKLLTIVEQMAKQLTEVHEKLSEIKK